MFLRTFSSSLCLLHHFHLHSTRTNMQSKIVFVAVALLVIASAMVQAAPAWYSITGSSGSYRIVGGQSDSALAQAYWDADVEPTGWANLGLYSSSKSGASAQARAHAAGYLEGTFTPAYFLYYSFYLDSRNLCLLYSCINASFDSL